MNLKTIAIAEGLQKAIVANDAEAIAAGISALSMSLGGVELINVPWSPAMQTLYVLSLFIAQMPVGPGGNVVSIHGVPLAAGDGTDAS